MSCVFVGQSRKLAEVSVFHEQEKGVSEHNVTDLGLTFSLPDQVSTPPVIVSCVVASQGDAS